MDSQVPSSEYAPEQEARNRRLAGDELVTQESLLAVPVAEEEPPHKGPADPPLVRTSVALRRLTMRLGERIVAEGWITSAQLEAALEVQKRSGGFLGQTLVAMGYVTPAQLGAILEETYGVPYVDLAVTRIDPDTVRLIPEEMARRQLVLPLRVEDDRLVAAMVDPLDLATIDQLRLLAGRRVAPVLTTERELLRAINEHFDARVKAHDALADLAADPSYRTEERAGPGVEA
ncbi:MAG: hypothetical protein C4321_04100, partial [Chloroflexota bacterium]